MTSLFYTGILQFQVGRRLIDGYRDSSTGNAENTANSDADETEVPLFEVVKGDNSSNPSEEGKSGSLTGKRQRTEIDHDSAEPSAKVSKT